MSKYNPAKGCYCESSKYKGEQSDILHDWKVIREYKIETIEVCNRCGLRAKFDRRDNKTYLETHKRDFLQPTGATKALYYKEYGKPEDINKGKDETNNQTKSSI